LQHGTQTGELSTFMKTLAGVERIEGRNPDRTPFLATHPGSAGRATKTAKRAPRLERASHDPVVADHDAFLEKLNGLLVGRNAAEGVFIENRFLQAEMGFRLEFPEGWHTKNAPELVAGASEGGEALFALSIVAKGDDPVAAAISVAQEHGLVLNDTPEARTIDGLRAAHTTATHGRGRQALAADLTWIAHRGLIFQLVGMVKAAHAEEYRAAFSTAAASFGTLSDAEYAEVTESRLRIVRAKSGETIEQLVERSAGTWGPDQTAVANAWPEDTPLDSGQLLKVPKEERFEPTQPQSP